MGDVIFTRNRVIPVAESVMDGLRKKLHLIPPEMPLKLRNVKNIAELGDVTLKDISRALQKLESEGALTLTPVGDKSFTITLNKQG